MAVLFRSLGLQNSIAKFTRCAILEGNGERLKIYVILSVLGLLVPVSLVFASWSCLFNLLAIVSVFHKCSQTLSILDDA